MDQQQDKQNHKRSPGLISKIQDPSFTKRISPLHHSLDEKIEEGRTNPKYKDAKSFVQATGKVDEIQKRFFLSYDESDEIKEALKAEGVLDSDYNVPSKEATVSNAASTFTQKIAKKVAATASTKQPTVKKARASSSTTHRRDVYKPGNVIHSSYWDTYDKVLDYNEKEDGDWNVTVQQVKGPNDHTPVAGEKPRTHRTEPGKDKVVSSNGVQQQTPQENVVQEIKKSKAPRKITTPKAVVPEPENNDTSLKKTSEKHIVEHTSPAIKNDPELGKIIDKKPKKVAASVEKPTIVVEKVSKNPIKVKKSQQRDEKGRFIKAANAPTKLGTEAKAVPISTSDKHSTEDVVEILEEQSDTLTEIKDEIKKGNEEQKKKGRPKKIETPPVVKAPEKPKEEPKKQRDLNKEAKARAHENDEVKRLQKQLQEQIDEKKERDEKNKQDRKSKAEAASQKRTDQDEKRKSKLEKDSEWRKAKKEEWDQRRKDNAEIRLQNAKNRTEKDLERKRNREERDHHRTEEKRLSRIDHQHRNVEESLSKIFNNNLLVRGLTKGVSYGIGKARKGGGGLTKGDVVKAELETSVIKSIAKTALKVGKKAAPWLISAIPDVLAILGEGSLAVGGGIVAATIGTVAAAAKVGEYAHNHPDSKVNLVLDPTGISAQLEKMADAETVKPGVKVDGLIKGSTSSKDDKISKLAIEISKVEGFPIKGSVSQRNNNPGNMVWGKAAEKMGATSFEEVTDKKGKKRKYATFPSAKIGWNALKTQIKRNVIDRGLSVKEFIEGKKDVYGGYAPREDDNNVDAYEKNIMDATGFDLNSPIISQMDPNPIKSQNNVGRKLEALSVQKENTVSNSSSSSSGDIPTVVSKTTNNNVSNSNLFSNVNPRNQENTFQAVQVAQSSLRN